MTEQISSNSRFQNRLDSIPEGHRDFAGHAFTVGWQAAVYNRLAIPIDNLSRDVSSFIPDISQRWDVMRSALPVEIGQLDVAAFHIGARFVTRGIVETSRQVDRRIFRRPPERCWEKLEPLAAFALSAIYAHHRAVGLGLSPEISAQTLLPSAIAVGVEYGVRIGGPWVRERVIEPAMNVFSKLLDRLDATTD